MKYSDQQRIEKIYDYANRLHKYVMDNNITKERLLADFSLQWLVTTPLYNIGEHAHNLSENYKNTNSDIQWAMIAGLRHRLVHDYDGTNWSIIADVILDEIPILLKQISKLRN